MNKDETIDASGLKMIAAILAGVFVLVAVSVWLLLLHTGNPVARQIASRLQSGTQVYFDEGAFGGELYGARVTAYDSGRQLLFAGISFVRGSTLPDISETNFYPTVASGAYSYKRGQHFGTRTNEIYQSKTMPALILKPGTKDFDETQGLPVPTLSENLSPYAGNNFRLKQASHVHVHAGLTDELRGSTACLTIAPDQAQSFFDSDISQTGKIHIRR